MSKKFPEQEGKHQAEIRAEDKALLPQRIKMTPPDSMKMTFERMKGFIKIIRDIDEVREDDLVIAKGQAKYSPIKIFKFGKDEVVGNFIHNGLVSIKEKDFTAGDMFAAIRVMGRLLIEAAAMQHQTLTKEMLRDNPAEVEKVLKQLVARDDVGMSSDGDDDFSQDFQSPNRSISPLGASHADQDKKSQNNGASL